MLKSEIRPLTGVRGIAAFLVMLYHCSEYPAFKGSFLPIPGRGYLCVDLFFVLSGFVLAMRYENSFHSKTSVKNYRDFLFARFARIYPAYIIIMTVFYVKNMINISGRNQSHYSVGDFIANLTLVQGWGFQAVSIISDSWSVSVELFAYLLFPVLLTLTLKRSWLVTGACVGVSFATMALLTETHYGVNGPLDLYRGDDSSVYPLLRCLAEFSLGLASYRLAQIKQVREFLTESARSTAVVLLLGLTFLFDRTDILTVLVFPILVICLFYDEKISSVMCGNRLVFHLGNVSYSMYLLHPVFLGVASHYAAVAVVKYGWYSPSFFTLMGVASTWLASYASYRYVEGPGRRALQRLLHLQR